MKIIIYILVLGLLISGCRERGVPFIPSKHSSVTKKKDFKDFLKLTLKAKSPTDVFPSTGRGILTKPTVDTDEPTENKIIKNIPKKKESITNTDLPPKNKVKKDEIKKDDTNKTVLTSPHNKMKKDKVLFKDIPILNKIGKVINDITPKSTNKSKKYLKRNSIKNHKKYTDRESFSGGLPINGLDIGMVRLGQGSAYTRLIFDSYKWEGYAQIPVQKVPSSGTYIFTYEPKYKRITAILDGYQSFSALVGDHDDLYHDNDMVKTIHIDEYLDKSGYKFTIELKQEADVNIFELHNPARIIIDMKPKPIE